jgi:hypothetical protein
MADMFKERYRELPIFQQIRSVLDEGTDGVFSLDELTTKVLIAAENGLNWDTLCQNCGALMDDNYAQYEKIRTLEEDLAYAENELRIAEDTISAYERMYDNGGF